MKNLFDKLRLGMKIMPSLVLLVVAATSMRSAYASGGVACGGYVTGCESVRGKICAWYAGNFGNTIAYSYVCYPDGSSGPISCDPPDQNGGCCNNVAAPVCPSSLALRCPCPR